MHSKIILRLNSRFRELQQHKNKEKKMSIRINNAKNFKGKAYVAADELDKLIKSLALSDNKLTFTTADGGATGTQTADLSGLVKLVNNGTLLTVSSNQIDANGLTTFVGTAQTNKVVMTDGKGNLAYEKSLTTSITDGATDASIPTEKAVKAYVDGKAVGVTAGNGIAITGTSTSPKISANIKIAAVTTAEGYAASYKLMLRNPDVELENAAGAWVEATGDTINIVKDQFLKTGSLVYGTSATLVDGAVPGETTTKGDGGAVYPFIKLELNVNTNDNAADEDGTVATIYIPVNDLFHDKTAGNGIDADELASNKIQVKVDATSGKVYATKGAESAVLTVGADGIKVAGIQEAIDLAVNDEHAKMGEYVADVATKTQAAITAVEDAVTEYTTNVVQVVEKDVTPAKVGETTEYSCEVTARNIIGVFDPNGVQIYPEIKKGTGKYTLTADYGTEPADAKWTVVCTEALPALAKTTIAPSTLGALDYKKA